MSVTGIDQLTIDEIAMPSLSGTSDCAGTAPQDSAISCEDEALIREFAEELQINW